MKKLKPSSPLSEQALLQTADALRAADDRTAVLITGAWVDDALEELFRRHLLPHTKEQDELLQPDGVLGNSFAKAKLAYMLGWLYPDVYGDLKHLRDIRNTFAHFRESLTLKNPALKSKCKELQGADAYNAGGPMRPARSPRQRLVISSILAAREVLRLAGVAKPPREVSGVAPYLMAVRREVRSATLRQVLEALRGV